MKGARLAILSASLLIAGTFRKVSGEMAPDVATSKGFQAGNSRKSLSVDLVVASVGVAVAVFECWRRNRSSSAVSPPVGDLPPLRRAALYEAQRICINVRYEYLWIVSRRLSPSFLQE